MHYHLFAGNSNFFVIRYLRPNPWDRPFERETNVGTGLKSCASERKKRRYGLSRLISVRVVVNAAVYHTHGVCKLNRKMAHNFAIYCPQSDRPAQAEDVVPDSSSNLLSCASGELRRHRLRRLVGPHQGVRQLRSVSVFQLGTCHAHSEAQPVGLPTLTVNLY